MSSQYEESRRYREQWIKTQLEKSGWSSEDLDRGERYRKSTKYIVVGIIWTLFIIPAPIGLSLVVYGGYHRIRYRTLGETYVHKRYNLKREFNRRGLAEPPQDWSTEKKRWSDRLPVPDWW